MTVDLPSFAPDDVALLVSAVEQSLRLLREANERNGGNDAELIEYGRRYSILLEKLTAVLGQSSPPPAGRAFGRGPQGKQ